MSEESEQSLCRLGELTGVPFYGSVQKLSRCFRAPVAEINEALQREGFLETRSRCVPTRASLAHGFVMIGDQPRVQWRSDIVASCLSAAGHNVRPPIVVPEDAPAGAILAMIYEAAERMASITFSANEDFSRLAARAAFAAQRTYWALRHDPASFVAGAREMIADLDIPQYRHLWPWRRLMAAFDAGIRLAESQAASRISG